ncbi:MAG TPA: class I SAM-dependent methyltransferase [Candidatus Sulfotelmatobacter sp.]|jgi:SAM-dependent methyltransferase|nr:class I SAM-dependent methyltransferase [Candidatus Sulfotelmatobacter sp.]
MMTSSSKAETTKAEAGWGNQYRLIASDKWKAKSAVMGKAVTEALVEYARPKPSMRVLDLASGTGEPAISIAMRVGSQGHVTALDLSADLLQIAKGRAQERGLENFYTQQADAQSLPFDDNSFDLATCRFGVMFFYDAVLALRELHRVLRPGARACFAAWGPFDQPYWQSTMGVVHRYVGGPLLPPGGPDPFRFAEPGSLSAGLRSAGFRAVEEETRTLPWTWPGTPEEVWEQAQAVSVPFRPMLDRVPDGMWPQIRKEVLATVGTHVRGQNIEFGASVVMVSGTK